MIKIIFYQSAGTLWFNDEMHRYAELKDGWTFFSNREMWVNSFNNEDDPEVNKQLVQDWLPPDIENFSRNENNTILYMPFEMKEKLIQILRKLGFVTQKGNIQDIPTSNQLGWGNKEDRTQIYNNLTHLDILEVNQKKHMFSDINEVEQFLNKKSAENNGVSGIVVVDNHSGDNIVNSTVSGADGTVNISNIINSLAEIISITQSLEGRATRSLREQVKDFKQLEIDFKEGAIIITFVEKDDEVELMIIFINLDSQKLGAARTTAREATKKLSKMYLEEQ